MICLRKASNKKKSYQMSIDFVYPLLFSIISGARYQRVATYSVKKPVWSCSGSATLASPKSHLNHGIIKEINLSIKRLSSWLMRSKLTFLNHM